MPLLGWAGLGSNHQAPLPAKLQCFSAFHFAFFPFVSPPFDAPSPPACCRGNAFSSGVWGGADLPSPLTRRSGSQPIPMLRQGSGEAGVAVSLPVDSMLRPVRKVGGNSLPAAVPALLLC